VARLSDAEELEVDAARLLNRGLVRVAEGRNLVARERAVWDVDVSRVDVHVGEEVLPHEPMVGVEARGGDPVVLIEVEGHHARERDLVAVHVWISSRYTRIRWSHWSQHGGHRLPFSHR
jgi:hypothetical protein